MAEKTYPMTLAEKQKLELELEELKLVRRPEVVERIKIARSYGDLSENSEYEAAKDEQAFVEGQISSLETKIRYAEIVDSDAVAVDEAERAQIGVDAAAARLDVRKRDRNQLDVAHRRADKQVAAGQIARRLPLPGGRLGVVTATAAHVVKELVDVVLHVRKGGSGQ